MHLIDTHCHLDHDPLGADPRAVLERAADRGVERVIVPTYSMATWPDVVALARAHPARLFAGLGLHPWVADQVVAAERSSSAATSPEALAESSRNVPPGADFHAEPQAGPLGSRHLGVALAEAIAKARTEGFAVVAIGEIGLDTKIEGPDLATQLPILRTQLELAIDLDLPVILHCRGAFEELLAEVDRFGGRLRGVLHAWSRGPELARRFVAAGLHLGLGGAVTRPRARRVRRTAEVLPVEHFVLETDAPSIGLDGVPAAETEPGHVADIAAALAEIRGETLATIAEVTTRNAERLFRLPS